MWCMKQNLENNSMKSTQNNIKFKFYCKTIISCKAFTCHKYLWEELGSLKTENRGKLGELVNKILEAQISSDI